MFFTRDDAGDKSWRFVEWNMNIPWFWVTVVVKERSFRTTNALMLYVASDIADLVSKNPGTVEIRSVQLVSPPQMNHTDEWKMESLAEIVTGIERNTKCVVHIYKCASGRTYTDSGVRESAPVLLEERVIFSAAA